MSNLYADAYHPRPFPVLRILLRSAPNALGLVQTEQTVVKLSYNILRCDEVIEHPLLAECPYVGSKDGHRVRAEVARLVHGDEDILQLKRLQLECTGLSFLAKGGRVRGVFWIPMNVAAVWENSMSTNNKRVKILT